MTEKLTDAQAISMLRKAFGNNKEGFRQTVSHSKAVQKEALRIAKKLQKKKRGIAIDMQFIRTASLLHDIGRSKCPPKTSSSLRHGIVGAEILRKQSLIRHAKTAERHIGAGITAAEAKKQGLPKRDYIPKTIEEKIIAHADNLAEGSKIRPFSYAYKRFEQELGKQYAERLLRLKKQVDP